MINKNELYNTPIDHVRRIRWLDFENTERSGRGSFAAELYPEDAERLRNAGWNVSEYQNPNYPDSDVIYKLTIYINYREKDGTPRNEERTPHVFIAEGRTRRRLYEDTIYETLKDARFSDAHIEINPNFSKKDPGKFTAYASEATFDLDTNSPKSQRQFNNRYGDMYDDE